MRVSKSFLLIVSTLAVGVFAATRFFESKREYSISTDSSIPVEQKSGDSSLEADNEKVLKNLTDIPDPVYNELIERLRVLEVSGTIEDIVKEMDSVVRLWGTSGGEKYGYFFRECLGHSLATDRIMTQSSDISSLRMKYALTALKRADSFDLETEWVLLGYLNNSTGLGELDKTGLEQRRDHVKLWLHALQRMESSKDPNFDEKSLPSINVTPPVGVNGIAVSGMSPESVKDPKLRAEYEKAIEENRKKIEHYNSQYKLRQDEPLIVKDGIKVIANMYSQPPYNMQELAKMLRDYHISAELVKKITSETEKRIREKQG